MLTILFTLFLFLSTCFICSGQEADWEVSCGSDTFFDDATGQCRCSDDRRNNTATDDDPNRIYLGGLMDVSSYPWAPDIFEFTVQQINQGRWGIIPDESSERLEYTLKNSNCDESTAARMYWDIRTQNGDKPPDAIVGARCSGASTTLARISGLEGVPQVSPASNSAKLTSEEFPYFSRLVAPNDERGEVGALVFLLRHFGWDRVTVLATDTQFAKDFATEFSKTWVGTQGHVAYYDTIRLDLNREVEVEAIDQVLGAIPEGHLGARVILLVAHSQHAFEVLERAHHLKFQPDTVWVGPSAWVGRQMPREYQLPFDAGYLGVSTFRNRNQYYQEYMNDLQMWQDSQPGKTALAELPSFAAETVDAIRAISEVLVALTPLERSRGSLVVDKLRQSSFEGVSGHLRFTTEGDRANPQYSVFNYQSGTWVDIGAQGATARSVSLNSDSLLCFAEVGCKPIREATIPPDSYPSPASKLPVWVVVFIVALIVLFIAVTFKYWRSRSRKRALKLELDTFRNSVVGIRAAECDYIPRLTIDEECGLVLEPSLTSLTSSGSSFTGTVSVSPEITVQWCWKESSGFMDIHSEDEVHGDPADCWIKYADSANEKLEQAFQAGKSRSSPLDGYSVIFKEMTQMKLKTKFKREVKRVSETPDDAKDEIQLEGVQVGDVLPSDLDGEPQMVLIESDVVQISRQRDDGWAFGTKLHHADETAARQLVTIAAGAHGGTIDGDANVFADTGWFQLDYTRVPDPEDLETIKMKVGDSGALEPPPHWEKIKDPTVVQRHTLDTNHPEYCNVRNAFMSTLSRDINIVKIERIQNLTMWQSYIVKRQTICYRETGHNICGDNGDEVLRKALDRFERSWLWHGTNSEVMDKIQQQGFNRSFCGKNATAYGKGVYFARDASYSSHTTYAVPDHNGYQYILACRVVVGEYCRGRHDALTPDVRDHKSHSLFDSTVDNKNNPGIFVTYHDAQAYPEYLITFKQN